MWLGTGPAQAAATTQICFAVDGSGSIIGGDFTFQKNGIAAAIEDPTVMPQNGTVELTVVQFDTIVKAPAVLNQVVTAANASPPGSSTLGNAIRGMVQSGGATAIGDAVAACTGFINGSPKAATSTLKAINASTNGVENTGSQTVAQASAAALAAGIDRLDFEAVGSSPNVPTLLAAAFPQPSEKVAEGGTPVGPQPRGFVMNVATFAGFEQAIRIKLATITGTPQTVGGYLADVNSDVSPATESSSTSSDMAVLLMVIGAGAVAATMFSGAWLTRRHWLK
jgi:hypothetical protein